MVFHCVVDKAGFLVTYALKISATLASRETYVKLVTSTNVFATSMANVWEWER